MKLVLLQSVSDERCQQRSQRLTGWEGNHHSESTSKLISNGLALMTEETLFCLVKDQPTLFCLYATAYL